MNDSAEHLVYSKNVLEFITVANDFSITLSKTEALKKSWFFEYLQKVLPLLYIKASLLPEIEVTNPEANERYFTQEEWEYLFNQIRNKVNEEDEFWHIDPRASNKDPIKASIAESLADIYQDVKDFLILYQKNSLDAKENAVNEIKRSFENRWGFLLVNVHKILHYSIMGNLQTETDQDEQYLF